jgi:GNAT superfamily N-acetyltransferase
MQTTDLVDRVEVLVDPASEIINQSRIAPGMGILYRYHPDSGQRLAEGFPRFAQTADGRLVLARTMKGLTVGYALIARPDPRERWSHPSAPEVRELGMIEVARGWRKRGIGRRLLEACFADGAHDERIVLATAYSWHWDLKGTGLSKAAYREFLSRFFASAGFMRFATNEPNIQEDPANQLFGRIGPRVNRDALARFLVLLQADRGLASDPGESLSALWKSLTDLLASSLQLWSPSWWLVTWSGFSKAFLVPRVPALACLYSLSSPHSRMAEKSAYGTHTSFR